MSRRTDEACSLVSAHVYVLYNLMLKWLSPCLLMARIRSFELLGFGITVEHCRLARRVMHPLTLLEARERGMQLPSSCIGPTAVRERSLEARIASGEALFAKLFDLPHQRLYWFCGNAYSRISDICNVPCVQTTRNTSGND